MSIVETATMSLQAFLERYTREGPFEFVDGEIIPLAPQIARSGRVGGRLFRRLADYVDAAQLGEVFVETPFVLEYQSDWVKHSRVPDVMFYTADRLTRLAAEVPDWTLKPLLGVPDLAVEVVSPTDKFVPVQTKIFGYLRDGVRLVWVIEPDEWLVSAYRMDDQQQVIVRRMTDIVTGEEVIPGLTIEIGALLD